MAWRPPRELWVLAHMLHPKGQAAQHDTEQAVLHGGATNPLGVCIANPGNKEAVEAVAGDIGYAEGGVICTDQLSSAVCDELQNTVYIVRCADRQDGSQQSVKVRYPVPHHAAVPVGPFHSRVYILARMDAISVVIVDDHPLFRQGTKTALESHGEIRVAAEFAAAREAIAYCLVTPPNVMLLDLNLPDLNGLQAAEELHQRCPAVGIIALTAHDDDAYVNAFAAAGGRGYLLKSASDLQIVDAIRAVAQGWSAFDPRVTESLLRKARGESPDGATRLTARELDVLRRAAEGLTNRQIGRALAISERTVQAHLSHVFAKLGVGSRTEATAVALRTGLIVIPRRV